MTSELRVADALQVCINRGSIRKPSVSSWLLCPPQPEDLENPKNIRRKEKVRIANDAGVVSDSSTGDALVDY